MEETHVCSWDVTYNHPVEPREIKYRQTILGFSGGVEEALAASTR